MNNVKSLFNIKNEPKTNFNVNKSLFEPKTNFNVNKSLFEPKTYFNIKNKSFFEPKINFNVNPFEDKKVEEKSWYCRDCDSFHTSDKNKVVKHYQIYTNSLFSMKMNINNSSKWNELDKKMFGIFFYLQFFDVTSSKTFFNPSIFFS